MENQRESCQNIKLWLKRVNWGLNCLTVHDRGRSLDFSISWRWFSALKIDVADMSEEEKLALLLMVSISWSK